MGESYTRASDLVISTIDIFTPEKKKPKLEFCTPKNHLGMSSSVHEQRRHLTSGHCLFNKEIEEKLLSFVLGSVNKCEACKIIGQVQSGQTVQYFKTMSQFIRHCASTHGYIFEDRLRKKILRHYSNQNNAILGATLGVYMFLLGMFLV